MRAKTVVVTGATSGLGSATASTLARTGADLVLLGRNEQAGQKLVRQFNQTGLGKAEFLRVDFSIQAEVRAAVQAIADRHPCVDVLINNAGARFDVYHPTVDGFELTFATNHLSHFLLTCSLLESLLRAPAARVVTVSSGSHGGASLDVGWQLGASNYDRRVAYANSKLANIVFAYALAHQLKDTHVTSNAVDPGGVATNFARNNGLLSWAKHLVAHGLRRELVSARRGAETIVWLASSPKVQGVTGKYFRHKLEVHSSGLSYDPAIARDLWDLSVELTGVGEKSRITSSAIGS